MNKYFIFSDIHGRNLDELKGRLEESGFEKDNPNHILVSLGDLFDRGNDSYNLCKYINSMIKKNRCIALWGNHEVILASRLYSNFQNYYSVIYANGTTKTIKSFVEGLIKDNKLKLSNDERAYLSYFYRNGYVIDERQVDVLNKIRASEEFRYYINHLLPYLVINDKYLLCHSGLTYKYDYEVYKYNFNKYNFIRNDRSLLVEEETRSLIIELDNNPNKSLPKVPFNKFNYDKVIHGHLYVSHFNKDDPYNIYFGKDNICLDSLYYINVLTINEDNSISFNKFQNS